MAGRKSSNSKLSILVSNTRNKTAILSLSILFTAIGILWQEKYISFDPYAVFTVIPLPLIFLLISMIIGFLSLFWILSHNKLAVRKAFKKELKPSIKLTDKLTDKFTDKFQENILGEHFLEPNPEEYDPILNSEIDIIPTEILEKEAETIAGLSDETRNIAIKENQLEPGSKDKTAEIKTRIAERLKKDIFNILSNR